MADESLTAVLSNARSVNSKLMKTNLGLLMAIRETDCDIVRAKKLLQKHHDAMQHRGQSIPATCHYQTRPNGSGAPPPRQPDERARALDQDEDPMSDSSSDTSSND
ncbi:hypothetical protein SDRG_15235 [Saprolegnia diclina VS20]|uniref:Uncharacterized protein n=1 Tax=Saprolegnia diclina (strain VS20) TaxID=1156394 RepID=T0RBI3_SAPDV|nr:hypothetical protein SDRG_15235 [Saprolegnia diclina VS20]EQC26902.1 hypothetical protein SDRG_15235 [Saprolegnia diclina VS20]|eukprot:XP_008619623.1 hypothetical protein SDRG_15235 [Saprolegnia diclina VS20]